MPAQQGLRRDDGGNVSQKLCAMPFAFAANRRRWSSLSRNRRLPSCSRKNAVFLAQVFIHL